VAGTHPRSLKCQDIEFVDIFLEYWAQLILSSVLFASWPGMVAPIMEMLFFPRALPISGKRNRPG